MANYESNVYKAQTGTSGGVSGLEYGKKVQYTAAPVKFTVAAEEADTVKLAILPVGAIVVSTFLYGNAWVSGGSIKLGARTVAAGLFSAGASVSVGGTPAAGSFVPVGEGQEVASFEGTFSAGEQDFTVVIGWISPTAS